MMFLSLKIIFYYKKCTISYLECKIRGVKKEEGYLYRLLEGIISVRHTIHFPILFILPIISIISPTFIGFLKTILSIDIVTYLPKLNLLHKLTPARSICEITQPPKISPLKFVSHGIGITL